MTCCDRLDNGDSRLPHMLPPLSMPCSRYDVREASGTKDVRNLGKPVELAGRYYQEGADEVTFLNITSFRSCPLKDQPMLAVSCFNSLL
jgi:imidazole glycerol phosphate synthase subunit HisF